MTKPVVAASPRRSSRTRTCKSLQSPGYQKPLVTTSGVSRIRLQRGLWRLNAAPVYLPFEKGRKFGTAAYSARRLSPIFHPVASMCPEMNPLETLYG